MKHRGSPEEDFASTTVTFTSGKLSCTFELFVPFEMMKLKSNQTRTYDGDGYKKRAACLCFRSEAEEEVSPGM